MNGHKPNISIEQRYDVPVRTNIDTESRWVNENENEKFEIINLKKRSMIIVTFWAKRVHMDMLIKSGRGFKYGVRMIIENFSFFLKFNKINA